MAGERFITIRKVHDAVEAEMLVDLLAQEGIVASTPGAAQSGYLGHIAAAVFETPLQVRERDAARAREIIAALRDYDEIVPEDVVAPSISDDDGPYRGAHIEPSGPPRKKLTAAAAAILMPMILGLFGAGHFYVREHVRGFLLLSSAWLLIAGAILLDGAIVAAIPLVIALDVWGAMAAIDRAG
mgnify:CR=1 FL=1